MHTFLRGKASIFGIQQLNPSMKKLLVLIFFFSVTSQISASHLSGGEIWYEYIGDSLNPYKYRIHLKIHRNNIQGWPTSKIICIRSSCFSSTTLNLPLKLLIDKIPPLDTLPGNIPGSLILPIKTGCVDSSASSLLGLEELHFAGEVTLPGVCSDFLFIYTQASRNLSNNLVNAPTFYIDAKLNNTLGPNTSPRGVVPKITNLCVNQPTRLTYGAIEPNGDSLYYEFTNPLTGSCPNIGYPVALDSGYVVDTPLTVNGSLNFNHNNGNIYFTPTQAEQVYLRVTITEYRIDTNNNYRIPVGSSAVDMQYNFINCSPPDSSWLSTKINGLDSATILSCYDSLITINIKFPVNVNTLSPDGSDFALYNSKDSLIPIVAAGFSGNNNQYIGTSFWLKLSSPLWFNDSLTLVSRVGNDLNTLLNVCGEALIAGDSILLSLDNCSTGIGLEGAIQIADVKVYPNPATNQLYVAAQYDTRKVEATIYTANGQPIKTAWLSKTDNRIDIEALPSGLYFISLQGENIQQVQSFQKE